MKVNVKVKSLSRVLLFVTPWTAAYQAPPSMGFSRQEYWSGLPLPSPGEGNSYPLKEMATHSGTLGTEKPGRLYVLAVAKSRTRLSDFTFTFHFALFTALEKEMATHSSVLAWRIPGTGEPRELPSMGSHRVGHG